ncbi:hypothetical protein BASA50_005312 [Batrachochytrium salamandrivorans]|uniref:non-specific serine/threonine protein kinase n=1 Tax=Batrachochytrium salamandrivorans TaxID=1357716 RepID=A0ABQ8FGD5_9FUNG|nr:hypothetical protein BASA62_008714 [Batrachochytrium salamandrivorans]KAH6575141.1 hypothetical protein BASA60_005162 [Batrachochytrium salamandrivorans]KAH6583399.1 hypothetical protein BASA61_008016 [Batrachochytrium salamandrivorans]KAH6596268.1 hypothetical protein BASA50_005312 [Batrachochytrium salamandrivorans]KAH9272145.1 hypothetical protein BASA83_005737 [Batrachochytrium salamandrivorans]
MSCQLSNSADDLVIKARIAPSTMPTRATTRPTTSTVSTVVTTAHPTNASASGVHMTSVVQTKTKNVGNYELHQTVGEGSFAKVKLATHRLTKQKVAVKIIDKTKLPDEYSLKNIHREAQIMRMIDHPNVIQLFEVMETRKNLFLVMEYASGGELLDYIIANGKLKEEDAKTFVRQILSALDYAHSLKVVHRDLKAENLLLDSNMCIKISGEVYFKMYSAPASVYSETSSNTYYEIFYGYYMHILDFGLSNIFDPVSVLATSCGSPVYSAPELIEGKKYIGPEVDAWSLGINVYAMVVGDLPFADANLTALYESILRGKYELPSYLSAECKDFISKLLVLNPKKRATISQMRDHSWIYCGTSFLEPISNEQEGGFRPKTEAQLDQSILDQLESMGFERKSSEQAIITGKFNQSAGTYYLLAHEQRQNGQKDPNQQRGQINTCQIPFDCDNEGLDSNSLRPRSGPIPPQVDITSDELARILFQVEGIRGPDELDIKDTKENNKHLPRDSYVSSTDRRNHISNPGAMHLNVAQANTNRSMGEIKPNKIVIKRARTKGTHVCAANGHSAISSMGLPPSPIQPTLVITKDSSESSRPRTAQSQSVLPKITQERTSRAFQSKIVNLPSIGNTITSSGYYDRGQSYDPSTLVKTRPSSALDIPCRSATVPTKPTNARLLHISKPIVIDESLYIGKDQDGNGSDAFPPGPMGVPRTIRFAFNCSAITQMPPEAIFERLTFAFENNDIDWRHDGYICECEWGDIKFEAEVCKLPRVCSYGVRLKRSSGDIWEYKKLCEKLTNDLESQS